MHYLNQQEDYSQLLINLLSRVARDQVMNNLILIFNQQNYAKYFKQLDEIPTEISFKIEIFEREAHELDIHDFSDFYESKLFKSKFRIVDKQIVCDLS